MFALSVLFDMIFVLMNTGDKYPFTQNIVQTPLKLFGIVYFFARPIYWGAPYAPSDEDKIQRMLSLARAAKGDRAVDVGSGDGRVVIALAKIGAHATGYEVNPILYLISKIGLMVI